MSNIETVTLDGTEIKVEGLGGQNTIITNRGTANLYASAYENITPDGDNVAAILPGGAMNLQDTNGTVYLLGTGKVQLQGTDTAYLPMSLGGASGGGDSAGSGVSQEYVDSADLVTLNTAKRYTDSEITAVNGEIATSAEETLTAAKGYVDTEIFDLKAYIGYTDSDIYGLEADFENNLFTRLAGAVGKNPGADFDVINAFGGRRRCAVSYQNTDDSPSEVIAYYDEENYEEDGYINAVGKVINVMVEQPKFYYKVVPLKTEKIDGTNGYHLRKARYYISDTPKAGFKVHPAFVQNGIEIDKIYLSAYEGSIRDVSENMILANDEQIADFETDNLLSVSNKKPASGTTQALTMTNARKLAQNIGVGWGITTIQTLSVTQLLFAIEYAMFNSQAAIGNGVVNATETVKTGGTSSLGNSSGVGTNGSVSYRGEENLWGNINTWVDRVSSINPRDWSTTATNSMPGKICINIDNSFTDPASTDTGIPSTYGAGSVSAFGYSSSYDWLFIPTETKGNTSIPIGDEYWNKNNITRALLSSGSYEDKWSQGGMFLTRFNYMPSSHAAIIGARLIYLPQPTEEVTS